MSVRFPSSVVGINFDHSLLSLLLLFPILYVTFHDGFWSCLAIPQHNALADCHAEKMSAVASHLLTFILPCLFRVVSLLWHCP